MKETYKLLTTLVVYLIILTVASLYCYEITNRITITRVYDGDTFYVSIDGYPPIIGSNIGIRVNGLDTPELRTRNAAEKALGYKTKALAKSILLNPNNTIVLSNAQRGKYFRIISDVYINGTNYANILIASNLAYKYDGGTKRSWADIIKSWFSRD